MIGHCSEQSQWSLYKRICNSDDRPRSTLANLPTPNCVRDDGYQWGLWGFHASGKCRIPKLLHCTEVFFSKSEKFIATTIMELYLMCAIFGDKYLTFSNDSVLLSSIISIYYVFHNEGEHAGCIWCVRLMGQRRRCAGSSTRLLPKSTLADIEMCRRA